MSTQVTIVGNVTDDPELRFTPGGIAVAKFSVAVNRRQFDRDANAWKDAGSDFHRVTVWRRLAEHVAESIRKGTRVVVVGDLRESRWTDATTQQPRSGWEISAEAVGAELSFATATVIKATRENGATDDPWATGSTQRPVGATAAPNGYDAEPPF